MTTRRRFLIALSALHGVVAHAQSPDHGRKPMRVGIFAGSTSAATRLYEDPFIDSMRDLGWVEGKNITFDRYYAEDDRARLTALAAEVVRRSPDLIYAPNTDPVRAAFNQTRTIPIVFSSVNDPVALGVVASLARPSGNVTGVKNMGPELAGKRLQLLKQALPKITRIGLLLNSSRIDERNPSSMSERERGFIEAAATSLGVTIVPVTAKHAAELAPAFAALAKGRAQAVLPVHVALYAVSERRRIVNLATEHRIPLAGTRGEYAEDGALMSYGSVLIEQIRRAAQLVDRILRGARPADIPVEQPTKFELVLNLKTAKTLGLTIPQSFVILADRLIE